MSPNTYLGALLSLPIFYDDAVISRDGKWAAWTWYRAGPTADVYVVPTDGSAAPLRMTDTGEDTELVGWAPDSRALLVKHDRQGDERVQLFRVELERPGVLVALTEPTPNYYIHGGALHPNGRWLFYGANVNEQGEEIEASWIYRHDLATGKRRVLARPEQPSWGAPLLNEQGTHMLYERQDRNPGGVQVWMVDVEGNDDHEVLNAGDAAKVQASWLPDGRRALVLAEAGDHRRVGVWDREEDTTRWLIDDPQRNIEDAFVPPGSPQSIGIIVERQGARDQAALLNIDTGEEQQLPRVDGNLVPLRQLEDDTWIGQFFSSTQPNDIVRFALDDEQPAAFTSLTRVWERTNITKGDLASAEDFRWNSVDGLEIQGWLYRTRDPNVTPENVRAAGVALQTSGVEFQTLVFEDEGHGISRPKNQKMLYEQLAAFFGESFGK